MCSKSLNENDKRAIISSLAIKAIGAITLAFAATGVLGIAIATTPLTFFAAIIVSTVATIIALDILTIGANISPQAKMNLHYFGFGLRQSFSGRLITEEIFGAPKINEDLNGTVFFSSIARSFSKRAQ